MTETQMPKAGDLDDPRALALARTRYTRRTEDTLHESGTFPTSARSALLIARAHLAG